MAGKLAETIAKFLSEGIQISSVADAVGKLSALDWLACGLAGTSEPVSKILHTSAVAEGGNPTANLFGGGGTSARMAALVNGTTSHALDYDDTHFAHIGHPSVAVYPAVFAMGQQLNRTLSEVLQAALIGMEVSVRIGLWLGRSHYQSGFHQTATAGAFGAGAAVGRLANFDETQMAQMLGLISSRAAGLKAQFGTMGKPYHAGLAAAAGVESAQLIQAGFDANPNALEGEFGYGATHCGSNDSSTALKGLGEDWLFESVSHKFHACCHGLHAALEAARELELAAPEIAGLHVKTHPRWMSVCNQPAPDTGLGAKFSYRTVLAMSALGLDTARLETYSDQICQRPDLKKLREIIFVEQDEKLTETEAVLCLTKRDGQRCELRHDLQSKIDLSSREQRVRFKAQSLIGKTKAELAWAMLHRDQPCSEFAGLFAG